MRKFLVILLVLSPLFLQAHTDHYKNYTNIEMEIFKDDEKIGESIFTFKKEENKFNNVFAITKFGKENLFSLKFEIDDAFLFGNETSGLPSEILNSFTTKNKLRIPMKKQNRSLNLSNAASIVLYEAWRQNNFKLAELSFNGK